MVPGRKRLLSICAGVLLLAACEPEATPLPVNLPTVTPAITETAAITQTTRYAISSDDARFLSAEDTRLIGQTAELLVFDERPTADTQGTGYELLVALGGLEGGTEAPAKLQISLIVNTALAPLNAPEIAQIVTSGIDPQAIADALGVPASPREGAPTQTRTGLRTSLANAGYPDGFDLTLAAENRAVADLLIEQLGELEIEARLAQRGGEAAHLTLISGAASGERIVPMLTIPIFYRAVEGLALAFTPAGFPVVRG